MPVELTLKPRETDLGGGMAVRRALPAAARQAVGPFVFFDHFGPLMHQPGVDHDVPPHPHIGLATVTYLLDGTMMHRDSIGSLQRIEPGAINWMTAGRGIAHSERLPDDLKQRPHTIHGLQLWAALPIDAAEAEPSFAHTPAQDIPEWVDAGVRGRVLIGEAFGLRSPVATFGPTLYLDIASDAGACFELPPIATERAVYPIDVALEIDGHAVPPYQLAVLAPGETARIVNGEPARYVVIGGAPLDGRRFIWWNFVASRRERIEEAKEAWRKQGPGVVPGDAGYLPLPER